MKPAVLATTAARGARRRSASGAITMKSPATSTNVEGARYAGSPNSKNLTAGPEEMIARPSAPAASAESAATGLDSAQAHKRLVTLDTVQIYRRGRRLPSVVWPGRIRLEDEVGEAVRMATRGVQGWMIAA